MLTVSGLFLRSAMQAAHVDPGFTFDRGVMIHADASLGGIDRSKVTATSARVLDSLRARPDVAAASASSLIPFGDITETADVQIVGAPKQKGDTGLVDSIHTTIGSGYFDALGLKVIDGRDFTTNEERSANGERLAIVDRPLAQRLFGNASPIGQLVQYNVHEGQAPVVLRVVGEVPGTRHEIFDVDPVPASLRPTRTGRPVGRVFPRAHLGADRRGRSRAASVASADGRNGRRQSARALDRNTAVVPIAQSDVRASGSGRGDLHGVRRRGARAVDGGRVRREGLRGSNRTREIGIRVALGATPRGVVWTVVREGLALSMTGLVIGLVLAVIVSAAMSSMTLRGQGADIATVGASMFILSIAAIAASWIPARKAAKADPISALRAE